MHAVSLSHSVTQWTLAHQYPLSMGFFQARTLQWVAVSYSRGSSPPRDQTYISCIGRQILYPCATTEILSYANAMEKKN